MRPKSRINWLKYMPYVDPSLNKHTHKKTGEFWTLAEFDNIKELFFKKNFKWLHLTSLQKKLNDIWDLFQSYQGERGSRDVDEIRLAINWS